MQSEWRLHSCSSETDVHVALNVLKEELYKIWQTSDPTEEEEAAAAAAAGGGAEGEAWIIVEPHPPSAFSHIEIVNAGSALVEVYGLREPGGETNGGDRPHDDNEMDFEMLLSAQQLMSVKDVVNKSNRNRLFVFSTSDKLSPLAAQHRFGFYFLLLTHYYFGLCIFMHLAYYYLVKSYFFDINCVYFRRE